MFRSKPETRGCSTPDGVETDAAATEQEKRMLRNGLPGQRERSPSYRLLFKKGKRGGDDEA